MSATIQNHRYSVTARYCDGSFAFTFYLPAGTTQFDAIRIQGELADEYGMAQMSTWLEVE